MVDVAPAPLIAAPVPPAKPTANDAAEVSALIVAFSSAFTVMSPLVLTTPLSALIIAAETSLLISLWARETPTEKERPPATLTDAARLVASVTAIILEVSSASRLTPAA